MDAITRLKQRLHENIAESTRDINFGNSIRIADAPNDKLTEISKKLNTSNELQVIEVLKRVLALVSHNRDLTTIFTDIVKLVSSNNLQIKTLAYVYLTRYAKICPDLAMLSVNSFQKDSMHTSPLVRAQAIRVLSSISSDIVAPVCLLSVQRATKDSNPYVRKSAALAIPKCYYLDNSLYSSLLPLTINLLESPSSIPIGAAAYAFINIHSDINELDHNLHLIHPIYRSLVRQLLDCEEWSQLIVLHLLARYARLFLPQPIEGEQIDKDLDALITNCNFLLSSHNQAVVMTASRLIILLGPRNSISIVIRTMIRILHESNSTSTCVIPNLQLLSKSNPELFVHHLHNIYIRSKDETSIKVLKLRIMENLIEVLSLSQVNSLIRELSNYAHDHDIKFANQAIELLGIICFKSNVGVTASVRILKEFALSNDELLITQSILQLRNLVANDMCDNPHRIVRKLLKRVLNGKIKDDLARASVIWLVGNLCERPIENESIEVEDNVKIWSASPDGLRRLLQNFNNEGFKSKSQIVSLAAKLLIIIPQLEVIRKIAKLAFRLANLTTRSLSNDNLIEVLDFKDRVVFLSNAIKSLIDGDNSNNNNNGNLPRVILRPEQSKHILMPQLDMSLKKNSLQSITNDIDTYDYFGTSHLQLRTNLSDVTKLPDWNDDIPPSSVRNEIKADELIKANNIVEEKKVNDVEAVNEIVEESSPYEVDDDYEISKTSNRSNNHGQSRDEDDLEKFLESSENEESEESEDDTESNKSNRNLNKQSKLSESESESESESPSEHESESNDESDELTNNAWK